MTNNATLAQMVRFAGKLQTNIINSVDREVYIYDYAVIYYYPNVGVVRVFDHERNQIAPLYRVNRQSWLAAH